MRLGLRLGLMPWILVWCINRWFLIEFTCHIFMFKLRIILYINMRYYIQIDIFIAYFQLIFVCLYIINIILMFDQLLENFEKTMKQAQATSASISKQLKICQAEHMKSGNNFFDPTKNLGKVASFPKSQRFKYVQKQQPRTTDSFLDFTAMKQQENQKKGVIFTKSQRFIAPKPDQMTIITPNYDVVKKNNKQAPKIVPASKQQMGKSRMSQATAASENQVGPGKYFINQEQTAEARKVPSFSKSKRFAKPKQKYQDTPLFVNDEQTKKRPPSMAVLKKKIQKNKKQITIQQQEQLRQRLKQVYWKSIPLQLDRLLKKHAGAPILKQKYFDVKRLKGRQRMAALMMLLNRLNYERGGFDNRIQTKIGEGPCGVVYRKSTPKPFKFSQMQPGPDYYYPQDDLIKPTPVGFTFAKKQQKLNKAIDNRDYEINEQYFKLGGNIIIMPQHKPHVLTQQQIRSLNRGPGFYDCLFSQVQKRDDIGVVKFQGITEKNARQNNCVDIKQVNDAFYFPSYQGIDPKIAGPVYKEPANVRPAHTPQKQLFPEHWLFYDGDLNKVRAEIAKNVLIGNGLNFEEYQKFAKKFKAFKVYMQNQRRQVEALQYNVKYDVIDPHVQGFDMAKQEQKTLIQPIVKNQFGLDGDNLLIQPDKPKKRAPQIDFGKMIGREEKQIGQDDDVAGDVLIIHPKKPEKHVAEIEFKKMTNRPQIKNEKNEDQQPAEGDRVILDPKLPSRKIADIDFSKQPKRQIAQLNAQNQLEQKEQLVISPEKPKKIKGFVDMQRMAAVRLVPHLKQKKLEKASVIKPRSKQKGQFVLSQKNQNEPQQVGQGQES